MLEYMKEIENKKRNLEEEVDQRNDTIAQLKAKELTIQEAQERKTSVCSSAAAASIITKTSLYRSSCLKPTGLKVNRFVKVCLSEA